MEIGRKALIGDKLYKSRVVHGLERFEDPLPVHDITRFPRHALLRVGVVAEHAFDPDVPQMIFEIDNRPAGIVHQNRKIGAIQVHLESLRVQMVSEEGESVGRVYQMVFVVVHEKVDADLFGVAAEGLEGLNHESPTLSFPICERTGEEFDPRCAQVGGQVQNLTVEPLGLPALDAVDESADTPRVQDAEGDVSVPGKVSVEGLPTVGEVVGIQMIIGSGDRTAGRVADVGKLVDGFFEGNPLEPAGVKAEFYGGTSFRKG